MRAMVGGFILDRNGDRHRVETVIEEWRGPALPDDAKILSFLIHTLGCARIYIRPSYCEALLNWSAIADETAIALIFSFHDYEASFGRPIFLTDQTQLVWRFEDGQTASAHILKTVRKLSERRTANFSRHPVPIDAPTSSAFATLAALCRPRSAPNSERCRAALRNTFANRYCVVRPSADGERLQLAEFGNGYDHIDEHWNTRTIGTPFGEFEDIDYSRFVKSAYASAWETWKPVLEEINIRKPVSGVPSRYLRILLPTMWGDQPALLSTSLPLNA